jgi:hypothetical protein
MIKETVTIQGVIKGEQESIQQASAWANRVRFDAMLTRSTFMRKGKKKPHTYTKGMYAGRTEEIISDKNLKYRFKFIKGTRNIEGILFNFPLHGIQKEYGTGRGQPRQAGKKQAKRIYIKRNIVDWIDGPIDAHQKELADQLAEYYGDLVIKSYRASTGTKRNLQDFLDLANAFI